VQPEQRRKKSANVARARMFIKNDLGWLPGYPVGLQGDTLLWRTHPALGKGGPPSTLALGREQIRRAALTRSKLVRRFPRALPKAVADLDAWTANSRILLELVKAAVHAGQAPSSTPLTMAGVYPRSLRHQAAELSRAHPGLAGLVDVLGWLHILAPATLGAALTAVEGLADTLCGFTEQRPGQQGIDEAVALVNLTAADGVRRVLLLASMLSLRATWRAPMRGAGDRLEKLQASLGSDAYSRERLVTVPWAGDTCMGPHLVQLLHGLHGQRQRARRRSLELLGLLLPADITQRSDRWWTSFESGRSRCPPASNRRDKADRAVVWGQHQEERLKRLANELPPEVDTRRLAGLLAQAGEPSSGGFWGELARTITWLPMELDSKLVRLAFFGHWAGVASDEGYEATRSIMPEIRRYLGKRCTDLSALAPWGDVLETARRGRLYNHWTFDAIIVGDLQSQRQRRVAFEVLHAVSTARPGQVDSKVAELVPTLVEAGLDRDSATARLVALVDAERTDEVPTERVALAHSIADDEGDFPMILGALDSASLPHTKWTSSRLLEAGEGELLRRHLREHGQKRLVRIGAWGTILERMSKRAVPVPHHASTTTPAWIETWPAVLQADIAALEVVDPDAEQRLPRLLAQWVRRPEDLDDEIAALRAVIVDTPEVRRGRLEARLDNLERRRTRAATATQGQLDKAHKRLRRARQDRLLEAWERDLTTALDDDLPKVLGLATPPPWLRDPEVVALVPAILALRPPFPTLGLSTMRRRAGPPPWDLREAPANAAFLDESERRGLNLAPWLDTPPLHEGTLEDIAITLALTQDPLDVLRMGAPFGTCLAPGDFNFFSTVANAVDINKRLLCAWNAEGTMVARCLLALTDAGGLLTFHAYANTGRDQFASLAATYVDALAREMRTVVVERGAVKSLVAPEWYDDGPEQLPSSSSALHEGSQLRRALMQFEPAELIPALESALAPRGLDALTLPAIAHLPELGKRPELGRELLPILRQQPESQQACLLPLCALAMRTDDDDDARLLLRERAMPVALEHHRQRRELPFQLLVLLVEVDPAQVLAILRRTRPRGRRRAQRQRGTRQLLRGLAFEALDWRSRARDSFEAVIDDDWTSWEQRRWARKKLKELGDSPAGPSPT
jgi:hypothetical protein